MMIDAEKYHWKVILYILQQVENNAEYNDIYNEHTCNISFVMPDKDFKCVEFISDSIEATLDK